MRYGVLGPLAAWDDEGRQIKIPEAKVRMLLAILLAHHGRPVPADLLVEELWAGDPPGNPSNTLQTKISRLRHLVGRDEVIHGPAGYRLRLDGEEPQVDARLFQALADGARATADPGSRARLLADALMLWRGPAYADVADAPFACAEITRLEELRLTALEDQAEVRLELGEHALLATELGDLVTRHPLRERLRMAQMRALYLAGRQSEALAAFHELRGRLADELGVDPTPELTAMYEAILRQEPQPGIGPRHRTNLPSPVTALIGREDEVTTVRGSLSAGSGTRLITLTGPGGVGKTRLAVAAAHDLVPCFPDGVWLVELAGLARGSAPDDIADRVVTVLGLCDAASVDPDAADLVGWLGRALVGKRVLLLLDNGEHLVESLAMLAERLLTAASGAHLLVTSQETLDVPGEVVHPVPPLCVPGPGQGPGPDAAARSSAVRLFVERSVAAVPGFVLDASNASAVSAICRRLDGIPLALELVAPRLRVLSPDRLLERLDDRFNLPSGRVRGRPERQRTLQAMIDWSWELLRDDERTVLRRLAVHADGCTLEAAEAVCADDDLPARNVLGLAARLVDRSLVVREGERFRLLESVAAYCVERLVDAGELDTVRTRFTRYHTGLAERADSKLRGPEQRRWLSRMDAETVNLRRALDIMVHGGETEPALRLVNAMAWYWMLRGKLTEARRSLRAALSLQGGRPEARAVARAWLAGVELRTQPVDEYGEPPAALLNGVDDPGLRARLLWFLGSAPHGAGHRSEGRRMVEESLFTHPGV
ncbi:BTAD domain-containing putative transcriptional regulator [Rhizohabitans arisaemae]|uniref:BTAD domain-containing putative transcriptional regulator n=1 Tax=Rhizohabitans arisaemae TaxID=2720610 RepID=UPI0024B08382|nr:BTAD domain-containing putative transcriptional regulator [Rhizohabitans arisaemae]